MAPKKPAKPNGFVLFAQDLMGQHGRKYNSFKEAIDAANPLWARMSKDQRKPYEERAKELKGQTHPTRYTSEGLDVEELTREEQLRNQAEEQARCDIWSMMTVAYRKGEDAMASETFFVIHCNIFCHYPPADHYVPAEIAVLRFSLKDGFKEENIFHYIVKPGGLPVGYKFEAKNHSDETHLIPIPFEDDENDNQEEIYFNLKAFLEKKKAPGTNRLPILFADKKYRKMISRILSTWSEQYDDEPEQFRVYSLQQMLYDLKNIAAGEPVWTSIAFSDRELEKDVYAYVTDIACEMHKSTPKPLFCSRSTVLRYAFMICDNCCADLNIEMEPGHHVPFRSTIPDSLSSYGSTTRSTRSSTFGGKGLKGEFDTESSTDTWDTESIVSNTSTTTSTLNFDDQFPSLGKSKSQSQRSDATSFAVNSSSGSRSYAGAIGKNPLPSAFEKNMETLSISSGPPKGRGFRRRMTDTDSETGSVAGGTYAGSDVSDFPPIGKGRGRGFIIKTAARRPGAETNN